MATTRIDCCRKWDDLESRERALTRWQLLHQLCHSNVPFTAQRYAEIAGLNLRDARGLIGQARAKGWLIEMPHSKPRLHNGLLRKR